MTRPTAVSSRRASAPRPRKDSPATARIFAPTSRLKTTTTGEMSCGTMWRTRIRRSGLRSARGFHELAPADGEHDAAHEARVDGETHDGDHRVAQARTQARYDGEGQQDVREGHQDIGEPHDDRLGPGA